MILLKTGRLDAVSKGGVQGAKSNQPAIGRDDHDEPFQIDVQGLLGGLVHGRSESFSSVVPER